MSEDKILVRGKKEKKVKAEKTEKPKRASRAKKEPTKEEMIALLDDSMKQLQVIISDLKEDEAKIEAKIASLQLKQVPILLKETLNNLQEDCAEMSEELANLKNPTLSPVQE